jgi:hypothetical protein
MGKTVITFEEKNGEIGISVQSEGMSPLALLTGIGALLPNLDGVDPSTLPMVMSLIEQHAMYAMGVYAETECE